jgi:hypothetical protein
MRIISRAAISQGILLPRGTCKIDQMTLSHPDLRLLTSDELDCAWSKERKRVKLPRNRA